VTEARELASISDYAGLHAALRARSNYLGISRATLDDIGGLQDGYSSKLLAPVPIRTIGPRMLGLLLGALGCRLVLVEDDAALKRISRRLVQRRPCVNASGDVLPIKRHKRRGIWRTSEWSRVMNSRRSLLLSRSKRSAIARKAAQVRWRKKGGTS
jgi:hypothetical protein